MSLDFNPESFKNHLKQTGEIIEKWYSNALRGSKIYQNYSPKDIRQVFDEPLPMQPVEITSLLSKIATDVFNMSNFNPSPNYYGYITGGGNQAAILAEVLKNAINQNNLKWHSAPANSEIEKIVVKWICQFIGYTDDAGGVLVSGGSVGNMINLAVMRKQKCPVDIANEGMYGVPKMTVYVSEQGHSSLDKAMDMLGMGTKNLRKIAVDENFQIDCQLLEQQIEQDKATGLLPVCVVGIAGTTNTGAVDPLRKLGEIAKKYKLWYFIDGAYGLPGAGTELVGKQFDGLELADGLLVNPHKWFFVPFETACVIVKNKQHLVDTFSMVPDYLRAGKDQTDRDDLMDINLQLTKDFKALKVWMTFKAYGAERLKEAIENDCLLARYAQEIIEKSDDFELLAPVPLSIVCFRYLGEKGKWKGDEERLDAINEAMIRGIEADGRIFFAGTKIKGKSALRINLTNHRRTNTDIDYLFEVLRNIGLKMRGD